MSDFTKKDVEWWGAEEENAFEQQALILNIFHFSKGFLVTTVASGHCLGAVLSPCFRDNHPMAFYSKKLEQHEINWPPHEREFLAVKVALEK